MKPSVFSSFTDLAVQYDKDNTLIQWGVFLHLNSWFKDKQHDKFKILSLKKIIADEVWFLAITTDKLHAKTIKIKKGEAVVIEKGEIKCLCEKSIVDTNELSSMSLTQASKLVHTHRDKRIKTERIIDKKERLPDKYQNEIRLACGKTAPYNTVHLGILREIAGQRVSSKVDTRYFV
jgi:hypothetical protein